MRAPNCRQTQRDTQPHTKRSSITFYYNKAFFSLARSTQGVNYLFDRKLMEMPHALGLIKATTAAAAAVGVRRLIIILYARAHSAQPLKVGRNAKNARLLAARGSFVALLEAWICLRIKYPVNRPECKTSCAQE